MNEALEPDDSALALQEQEQRWEDAALAAICFIVGGHALGGVRLRARPGPVRDLWLEQTRELLTDDQSWRKIPLHCGESRLLGGLDLAATLRKGAPVAERGLLVESDGGVVLLAMAERAEASVVAVLSSLLDDPIHRVEREGIAAQHPCRLQVIALDEGVEDEALAINLDQRLALSIDLDPIGIAAIDAFPFDAALVHAAQARLHSVTLPDEALASICRAALALGVDSPRVSLLAARTARVLAAIAGAEVVGDAQLEQVLRLVLLPRATRLPAGDDASEQPDDLEDAEQAASEDPPQQPEDSTVEPDQPPPAKDEASADEPEQADREGKNPLEDDQILDAAQALLPADLLARLAAGQPRNRRSRSSGKSGAQQRHLLRGRPMGSVAGDPRSGARMDLMATLRNAAPWQALRAAADGDAAASSRDGKGRGARLRILPDDFRVIRFRQRAQSVTVFVVDASGSAALYRLAEAKGAIELLLADCYVRRDEVALIAFRGQEAELVLPPTRSLVRAKRSLSALPGGGGTPLGAAIDATGDLLEQLERRGATPSYVMLTDGRANVARDGRTGRDAGTEDAMAAAAVMRLRSAAPGMVIDTSPRPHRAASALAQALDALYLPLPNADAATLRAAVGGVAA